MWFLLPAYGADLAPGAPTLVGIGGMDCAGCEAEVVEALTAVDGVSGVEASFTDGRACVTVARVVPEAAIRAGLATQKLTATSFATTEACPSTVSRPSSRDPWGDATGIDLVTVSTGDDLELDAVAVPGKYTIVDFGAVWCGPCHAAVKVLYPYVQAHPDTAVRAVALAGVNASAAFATPIAKHWLADAAGIPWLVVYSPDGKVLYRGQDAAAAIRAMDRRRS
jgi:copper chaperone CopZ